MSGHLSLKWNNHSVAFLKSISTIQTSEKYCDATIVCQGKYFPVHRVILSTCSDYFDEIFERIQCPHPYIVFKDIEPREMELLLNYMYQGEVNVIQELLPSLIKAAEALRIKGLAVPDDIPGNKDGHTKKRGSSSSQDSLQPKRRSEEFSKKRRLDDSSDRSHHSQNRDESYSSQNKDVPDSSSTLSTIGHDNENQIKIIKEEPLDTMAYEGTSSLPTVDDGLYKDKNFVSFPLAEESSSYMKSEPAPIEDNFDQGGETSWGEFGGESNSMPEIPAVAGEMSGQDDVLQIPPESLLPVYSSSSHHQWPLSLQRGTGSRKRGSLSFSYCRFCDYKSSKGPSSVRRHVRFRHTGEKPFACLHCGKKFCEKTDLHTHLRIHTGEKPYQCRTCFKKFRVLNGLKSHYKTNVMCDPVNRYYSTPSET